MNIIPRLENFNPNFYYLLKKDIDGAIYIEDKKILFVNKINLAYAKHLFPSLKILPLDKFFSFLKKNKEKVKLDFSYSPIKLYKQIEKYAIEVIDYSEELKKKRMKKKLREVKYIEKANKIAKKILKSIEIERGEKEKEIEKKLKLLAIEENVELSFDPIVADIENAKFPHYRTGEKRVKKAVLIDFGVKYNNYCSDLTEVFFLSNSIKEKARYEKLRQIFYEIKDSLSEMKTAKDLAFFSNNLFKKYKIRKPPHLIGHGIGLEVHEYPFLHEKSPHSLKNTTIAIEPATYSSYGLRFERNLYIGKNRITIL